MVVQTLQAVVIAAKDALRVLSTTNGGTSTAGEARDALVQGSDVATYMTTEVMLAAKRIHTIHLSCDEVLARELAVRLLPSAAAAARPDASTESIAEAFRVFSSILQQSLAGATEWFRPTDDIVSIGPGEHSTRLSGASFFQLIMPASRGLLRVTVAIPSEESGLSGSASSGLGHEARQSIRGERLRRILTESAGAGAPAQVDLPVSEYKTDLHPARIISLRKQSGREILALHVPSADRRMLNAKRTMLVSFMFRGRHYQFRSETAGFVELPLAENVSVPMLACELPEELRPNERRRVFRIVPHPDTVVSIMPLYDVEESRSNVVSGTLRDLCVLGAAVASPDGSVNERSRQGRFVLCRVDLPEEWGRVEVPAVVRYVRASVTANRPEYRVGVKFLSSPLWKQYQGGLETICRYAYTRPLEGRRRRDEPMQVPPEDDQGMESSIARFSESFDRCRSKPNFIRRFYDRFLASSPEIQRMFEGTDFVRQSRMVETALVLLASLRTDPSVVKKLGEIADRHGRAGLKVKPELYDSWVNSLIATVEETDPKFSPAIETAWRTILAHGITFMKKRF